MVLEANNNMRFLLLPLMTVSIFMPSMLLYAKEPDRTAGKMYASTLMNKHNVKFIAPWQEQLISNLLERMDELPFNKIAESPATIHKMNKVGTILLTNKKFINTFAKAEGVDLVSTVALVAGIISDTGRLRLVSDAKEHNKIQKRLFVNVNKVLSDKALAKAARQAVVEHGDFLAKIIREEKLITETLGQKAFLEELNKYEEGVLLAKILHIPTVLQTAEDIIASIVSDKKLMGRMLDQKTVYNVSSLAMNSYSLLKQLSSDSKDVTIDKINAQTLEVMNNVVENGELIGMLMDKFSQPISANSLRNMCEQLEYTSSPYTGTGDHLVGK